MDESMQCTGRDLTPPGDGARTGARATDGSSGDQALPAQDRARPSEHESALRSALRELTSSESVLSESPVFTVLLRAAPGWPSVFASDNVKRLGHAAGEFTSGRLSWLGVVHPQDAARLESQLARCVRDQDAPPAQQHRLITRSGEVRWVECRCEALTGPAGGATYVRGVLIDITERKRAEQALRERQASLRKLASELSVSEERQRRNLAEILHDRIGQDLAVAVINLQLLRSAPLPENARRAWREALNRLRQIGRHIRMLTLELCPPVLL